MIEIVYILKRDKDSEPEIGYTYFQPKSQDFKKVVTEASKYFTKFCNENGYGKKATLKAIQLCKNENTTPTPRIVAPKSTPTPRKRSKSTRSSSPKVPVTKNKTSVRKRKV